MTSCADACAKVAPTLSGWHDLLDRPGGLSYTARRAPFGLRLTGLDFSGTAREATSWGGLAARKNANSPEGQSCRKRRSIEVFICQATSPANNTYTAKSPMSIRPRVITRVPSESRSRASTLNLTRNQYPAINTASGTKNPPTTKAALMNPSIVVTQRLKSAACATMSCVDLFIRSLAGAKRSLKNATTAKGGNDPAAKRRNCGSTALRFP